MGVAEVENRDDKRIIEQLIKVVGILAKNNGVANRQISRFYCNIFAVKNVLEYERRLISWSFL